MKKGKNMPEGTAELRRRAEERLKRKGREAERLATEQDAPRMVHELEVHQIELEMQNEELKEVRRELEEQLLRYSDLYNFAPVGYFTLDSSGTIMEVNLAGARLLGIDRSGLVGRRIGPFLHKESRRAFDECLGSVYEGSATGTCELTLLTEGDLPGHVQIEVAPVDSGGAVRRCRVAMIDITGRRRVEVALHEQQRELEVKNRQLLKIQDELELRVRERTAELQRAYDQLKTEVGEREQAETQLRQAQKMEALGTLTGGIAHDFNNILAAVIGFTELLKDRALKGSREEHYHQRVFEAGLRGRELIRQMLAFSRKTELDKKPIRLGSVVKETIRFLRASIPTTVRVQTDIRSESALVFADPTQMQQVLMNLCTNAAHAMQKTGGVLHVELSDFNASEFDEAPLPVKPGPYVRLTVSDTGTGISSDIIGKIFDPFFTTKAAGEGTGLGLSVVLGIVRQHDGHITVTSEPGNGSVFNVYLPKLAERLLIDTSSREHIPAGSERVLLIDDEETLAEMGQEMLEELGYRVTTRTSSTEALALIRSDPSKFDLVITDQTMPDVTGVDLAREIIAVDAQMPIIMCTGFSHVVDSETAKQAGIRAFAMKPLTKGEIARVVRKVLDESGRPIPIEPGK